MTALIRYKTPYTMSGKGSFVLSFDFINDVSLPSVLGLTHFSDMCYYRFRFQLLPCVELNRKFTLELYPLDKCLADDCSLTHYSPTIPPSFSTKTTSNDFMLYYTSAEDSPHYLCQNIFLPIICLLLLTFLRYSFTCSSIYSSLIFFNLLLVTSIT